MIAVINIVTAMTVETLSATDADSESNGLGTSAYNFLGKSNLKKIGMTLILLQICPRYPEVQIILLSMNFIAFCTGT